MIKIIMIAVFMLVPISSYSQNSDDSSLSNPIEYALGEVSNLLESDGINNSLGGSNFSNLINDFSSFLRTIYDNLIEAFHSIIDFISGH